MNKIKLTKSRVEFFVAGTKYSFNIYHNIKQPFGLSLEIPVSYWLMKTKLFDAKTFCKYLTSEHRGCIALTESEYQSKKKQYE